MSDELLSGQGVNREQGRLNLEGPLQEIQERLNEILDTERRTLTFRAEDDARLREQFLDSLPSDPAGAIRELKDYRFVDPEAQRKFDELLEWLREQVMGSYFRSMAEGMKGLSAEELRRFKDMLA